MHKAFIAGLGLLWAASSAHAEVSGRDDTGPAYWEPPVHMMLEGEISPLAILKAAVAEEGDGGYYVNINGMEWHIRFYLYKSYLLPVPLVFPSW
jgi:hypothetical protein